MRILLAIEEKALDLGYFILSNVRVGGFAYSVVRKAVLKVTEWVDHLSYLTSR